MKRKLMKRVFTFMMLFALLISTARPVFTYAEELPGNEEKRDTENVGSMENSQETEGGEAVVQSEGLDGTESGDKTDKNDNGQYDVTKPVIEKVEFPQQGTIVKADDTILLYVYAYDTGTDEGALDVAVSISTVETSDYGSVSMKCSYDEKEKRYVCNCVLNGSSVEKIAVSSIRVADKSGNYVDYTCYDENGDYKYWVNTEQKELKEIHIKRFEFKQNGQTLNEKDSLEMFMELEEEIEDDYSIYASFERASEIGTNSREFYLNREGNGKEFSCTETVNTYHEDGEGVLKEIYMKKGSLGKRETLQIDHIEECKYMVKKTEIVKEKPVIVSVSMDRNGEMLSAGDEVKITVEATSSGQLSEYGTVEFMPASNITSSYPTKTVDLSYDADAGIYQGILRITEDTYPCEWYIQSIAISDEKHNRAEDSKFTEGAPYYVKVRNGDTFVNPTYNINLDFQVLDENGDQISVLQVQKANVERRQTLKEVGVVFPEMNSQYPGFTQIGWADSNGEQITEDMQIMGNLGYMTVYAKYNKKLINVYFQTLKKDGTLSVEKKEIVLPYGATYGDLRKEIEKTDAPEVIPGLTFQKWEMSEDHTDESVIKHMNESMRAYAIWDKCCIGVSYNYVDAEGKWQILNRPIILEIGATYGNAIKEAQKYIPKDITGKYKFEQWDVKYNGLENTEVPNFASFIELTAKYSGKVVIPVRYGNVYDEEGCYSRELAGVLVVDEGTTGAQVMKVLDKWEKPRFYPGLRLKQWKYIGVSHIDSTGGGEIVGDEVIKNGQVIVQIASYENCLIRYCIDPIFDPSFEEEWDWERETNWDDHNLEAIFCQVAEKGEKVTFPETFEGYQKIIWVDSRYQPGDTFTVEQEGVMGFDGYGIKDSVDPDQPISPSKPVSPEKPITPNNPEFPEQVNPIQEEKLSESAIQGIVNTINKAGKGEFVRVDMGNATVVSREILEAAKGKDVNIQLNMNGYTWTINGASILANDLKDINLKVIPDTNNIPSETIQALAGDNPTRQLTLLHEGDFGFKATLTINMGNEYSGKYGNLYYHDSDGKMVFINAGKISPNGDVSLEFSHASDYVIVMNDKKMSQTDVPSSIAPMADDKQKVNQNKSPKTGDNGIGVVWMLCGLSALGVICFIRKKDCRV